MERAERPKTLIFGGAFDPPTIAHQAIIAECLKLPEFEKTWVMPCGERFDKTINATDYQRLTMLRLMKREIFPDSKKLEIVGFELFLDYPMTTYLTVGRLALAYPNREFWYAYGADSYAAMEGWPGGEELKRDLNLVVFTRAGNEIEEKHGLKIVPIEGFGNLSSTLVREAIRQEQPVDDFVCNSVASYVAIQRLYKDFQNKNSV